MEIQVLIVSSDTPARRKIRQLLDATGYTILEADDVESGLAALRASEGTIVTLFNVALFNNSMAGTDGSAFLGAAQNDTQRGRQHAFVVVTPTPDHVHAALGRLLAHLSIPVLAEPFTAADLADAIDQATPTQLAAARR
jgi:CheY-like chemotaxis protein